MAESEIEAITTWLSTTGFTLQSEHNYASFGDRGQEWERGDVRYRVVRDRSQWFVDTSRKGWTDWFEVDLVTMVCDLPEMTASEQTRAAASLDLDDLLPALIAARRRRVEEYLGVQLPTPNPDGD